MLLALLFGFLFGFIGSMPLAGPIAVLVFRHGLRQQSRAGLALAAGAALAESAYAFLAYWGMGALLVRFPVMATVSRGAAVLILLGLGVWFVLQKTSDVEPKDRRVRARSSFALGLIITSLNPTFLATWSAAVTVLHSLQLVPRSLVAAFPFALGVGVGIVGWFWLMLALIRRYHDRLHPETLRRLLQAVGVVLIASGLWAAVSFARALAV